MRVLWFTNTPTLFSNKLGEKVIYGGWMHSLANYIKNIGNVDLGIAFYWKKSIDTLAENSVKIYPIYDYSDRFWHKLKNKLYVQDENKNDINYFMEIVEDFEPDIIHIHGTEMAFGKLAYYTDIPIVISIQGNATIWLNYYYSGISQKELIKYGAFRSRLIFKKNQKRLKLRSKRELKFMTEVQNIIGRTDWDWRITRILSPQSDYYHNDEMLRDIFYQTNWKSKSNFIFQIFTVTRSALYKGLETIVETVKLLSNLNFKFIWKIGGVKENDKLVKLLEKKYKNNFIHNRMKFLGVLNSDEIAEQMKLSDLFVLPSHIENSSNSLCEAMLVGMPCIATFTGGTSSILNNNESGILVQPGDPWAMAGAIYELYQNPKKASKIAGKAQIQANKRHNPDKISKNLIEIYKDIINKK